MVVAHRREQVTAFGEPRPDRLDRELARVDAGLDLVPGDGRRHRRTRFRADRVDRRDVRALAVHVVVDEDLPGAFLDPPAHRHAVGVDAADHPPDGADEGPDRAVRPAGFERHEDLEAGRPARLRVRPQPERLERRVDVARDREDVVERDRFEGVEVEEQVVGSREARAPGVERVHLDAAEVRGEQEGREVVDRHVVDRAVARVIAFDEAAVDPRRRLGRDALLVEEGAGDAVGHPLHRERPAGEVREDPGRGVPVVGEEVALRVALLGPEDLVEVREAHLPPVGLDPPCVAPALGGDRLGERGGEGLR